MFVSKVNNVQNKPSFKGYRYEINDTGEKETRFYYPQGNNECYIQFYRVKKNPNVYSGYEVLTDKPFGRIKIENEGTVIDVDDLGNLDPEEAYAYQVQVGNQYPKADAGIIVNNNYTLVSRKGTTPLAHGTAIFTMADIERPGAYYEEKTGKIIYDKNLQKEKESVQRNFANKHGGGLAGIQYTIDNVLKPKIGNSLRYVILTPITGADTKSHHGYWNKNNMQTIGSMGTAENYDTFMKDLFRQGLICVQDGTFTSEGIEGIHISHVLKHGEKSQFYNWFRMSGIKDAPIGLGVIPQKYDVLRYRVINPTHVYDNESNSIVENKNYDSSKRTLVQVYDNTQVTDEQLSELDKPIEVYENLKSGNLLSRNTHDDTIINYICEVNPKEYLKRLHSLVEFNKTAEEPIKEDSPEGAKFICQFSNFKIINKTESGGVMTWDANTDMIKFRYDVSNYDDMNNMAITDIKERNVESEKQKLASFEAKDLLLQTVTYWTKRVKTAQIQYTAKTLGNARTVEDLKSLIAKELLPDRALLSKKAIENLTGPTRHYRLEPKGRLTKEDKTIQALMELPLDSLELGENTVSVLSTSYFSNRAINEKTLGLSRYDLYKQDNPQLLDEYAVNYIKTNRLFTKDLRNFAEAIIDKINESSSEKLLDEKGNYTEYGEYIIENYGKEIAKYGLFKALAGSKLDSWQLTEKNDKGVITYNYKKLMADTELRALGINENSPEAEARKLLNVIQDGMDNLTQEDIDFVASSIKERIKGTDVMSFRLAEAIVDKSALGLGWRGDALKDTGDQDAVRSRQETFDNVWNKVGELWGKVIESIKKVNPYSYTLAEITDVESLMKNSAGSYSSLYDNVPDLDQKFKSVNDAMVKFFVNTGFVSEAAYSYTFTDIAKVFGPDIADGNIEVSNSRFTNFINNNFAGLISNRSIDFARNLYTFPDNHDKPSIIHGFALDYETFYANLENNQNARKKSLEILSNSYFDASMPIELRLNLNNMDYFRTVNPRAIAMSVLLRETIDEDLAGTINSDEKYLLKEALKNFSNGNVKGELENVNLQTITIPELSSLENALTYLLKTAGITLNADEFQAIINKANEYDVLKNHFVGYDIHCEETRNVMGDDSSDYSDYSLYTVCLAGLLKDAFAKTRAWDKKGFDNFSKAAVEFVKKFDKNMIEQNQRALPVADEPEITRKKSGYASKDFEMVIRELIEEAKYIASKDDRFIGKNLFATNSDDILVKMFRSATEPAVQKALMYAAYLSIYPGIGTTFIRNMLCGLGYDEKTKNVYLQSRNPNAWNQLEEGPLKEYRQKVFDMFIEAVSIRSNQGGEIISNGTPYLAKTSNPLIPAIFIQDGDEYAISLFNALGVNNNYYKDDKTSRPVYNMDRDEANCLELINKDNKHVPRLEKIELDFIELPAGISIPDGTRFKNLLGHAKDEATYVARVGADGITRVVNEIGKIVSNGSTARQGAMALVKFKGRKHSINKQYNFNSNVYVKKEETVEGKNLSLIAR